MGEAKQARIVVTKQGFIEHHGLKIGGIPRHQTLRVQLKIIVRFLMFFDFRKYRNHLKGGPTVQRHVFPETKSRRQAQTATTRAGEHNVFRQDAQIPESRIPNSRILGSWK